MFTHCDTSDEDERYLGFKKILLVLGVICCLIFAGACLFNHGKLADDGDEFSHWATVAKAMVALDEFGTNPDANLLYPAYPLRMALFQYFFLKIYLSTGRAKFSEWCLYTAYQYLFYAFILPFFNDIKRKNLFYSDLIHRYFLCPLIFFNTLYTTLYIDPIMGMLVGTGLVTVFCVSARIGCTR